MESNEKREVLVSVRLSTVVLVAFLILMAVVVASATYTSYLNAQKKAAYIDMSVADENIIEELAVADEPDFSATNYSRKVLITSRYAENREQITIINPEEIMASRVEEEIVDVSIPIEEVTISVDMDLTVRTGLSRDVFIELMTNCKADKSGFFRDNAGLIYDMCEKYSLNEIFFVGLISAESGWDIAQSHRNTYNYISLMGSRGLIRYSSVEDGMEQAAKTLHDKYLSEGGCFYYGPTLSAMKTRFCPASSTWVNLVYGRMQQVLK